jgi:hypothetical protein
LEDYGEGEIIRSSSCSGFSALEGGSGCKACAGANETGTIRKALKSSNSVAAATAAGEAPSPFKPHSTLHLCEAHRRLEEQSKCIRKLRREIKARDLKIMDMNELLPLLLMTTTRVSVLAPLLCKLEEVV